MADTDGKVEDSHRINNAAMLYKRGELIISEKPYVHVVNEGHRDKRCGLCGFGTLEGFTAALKCCARCGCTYYCSKACQRQDWKLHKHECKFFKDRDCSVFWRVDHVRLFYRVLLRWSMGDHLTVRAPFGQHNYCFNDLMSHSDDITSDKHRHMEFTEQYSMLKTLTTGVFNLPSESEALELWGKMVINRIEMWDAQFATFGRGIYLVCSKTLDHSCYPTAIPSWRGSEIQIRSISPGELPLDSVNINYTGILAVTEERRAFLEKNYYFLCTCMTCMDVGRNAEMRSGVCPQPHCEGMVPGPCDSTPLPHCSDCNVQVNDSYLTGIRELENHVSISQPNISLLRSLRLRLHYKNVSRLNYALKVIGQLDAEDIQEEIRNMDVLPGYRHYRPADDVCLATQLFKAGIFRVFTGRFTEALAFLKSAKEGFECCRGADDPWLNTVIKPELVSYEAALDGFSPVINQSTSSSEN